MHIWTHFGCGQFNNGQYIFNFISKVPHSLQQFKTKYRIFFLENIEYFMESVSGRNLRTSW